MTPRRQLSFCSRSERAPSPKPPNDTNFEPTGEDTKKKQLAQEYSDIFSALVDAYAQIAEALPRFDRFQKAFQGNRDFEDVLGILYAEILEFHRRAYKFFRRRGVFCL